MVNITDYYYDRGDRTATGKVIITKYTTTERNFNYPKYVLHYINIMTSTGILGKDQSTQYMDPPKGPVYIAIRDWKARNSTQLSIKKGEKLEIKEERTEGWWLARSLDTNQEGLVYINDIKNDEESEVSTLESLELFHYAMTENVDIPKIKEIKTRSNGERASLFLSLIKQDSVLLDQLRKKDGKIYLYVLIIYRVF